MKGRMQRGELRGACNPHNVRDLVCRSSRPSTLITISGGRSPEGVLVMDFRQTQMLTPMISGMLRARGPGPIAIGSAETRRQMQSCWPMWIGQQADVLTGDQDITKGVTKVAL